MTSDLEERLTSTLAHAADDAAVPAGDPLDGVRALQRRRRRRRVTVGAAGVAAAMALSVSAVVAIRPTAPSGPTAFASGRIPDFANLPEPEKLWPKAVHQLPRALPDGSGYSVAAVLGDDRYLVTPGGRGPEGAAAAPLVFDTRARTATALGGSAVTDGLTPTLGVLMAREVNGRAVWLVEGSRNNSIRREIWVAPLDGGPGRRLADLPDGSAPRFSEAGNAIIWDQQAPEGPRISVHTVSLSGGPATDLPQTQGFELANIAPWIKNQHIGTGTDPRTSGEIRNVMTGERLRWKAAADTRNLRCGPNWCVGHDPDEQVVLQSLDGSDVVELPYRGDLSQTDDGRLAIGRLQLPTGTLQVIWDRTTNRAAGTKLSQEPNIPPAFKADPSSTDQEPEVITVRSTDDHLFVLDLTSLR